VLEPNPQKEVCLPVFPQSDCLWQGWKRRRGAILEESYAQGLDFDPQCCQLCVGLTVETADLADVAIGDNRETRGDEHVDTVESPVDVGDRHRQRIP
jgi:hypothetical protein